MTLLARIPARGRIVGALFLAQSLFSAGIITAFTLTPIIAAELSGSENAAGLPTTVNLVGRAAAAYPLGWLLDRIGRRLGLSLGYLIGLGGGIVAVISIITGSFIGFLAGSALLGGSRAASEQGRYVAAELYPVSRQAKIMGLVVFAGTIGAVGGPLLVDPSGNLAERYGITFNAGPYVAAAVAMLLGGLVVFLFLRPEPLSLIKREENTTADLHGVADDGVNSTSPLVQHFRKPTAILALSSMVVGQMVMTLLMVITPLNMSHAEHSTGSISLVIMAHTLGMFGFSGINGWLVDKVGRRNVIFAGSMVLISAAILAPLSEEVSVLAIALFLLGLGWNLCFVAGSSLLTDGLGANERGRIQGAGEMGVALGAGAGSLSSGFIFAQGGMIAVSVVGLGFSLGLLLMVSWLMLTGRPTGALVARDKGA